jgi:hypothetical protein
MKFTINASRLRADYVNSALQMDFNFQGWKIFLCAFVESHYTSQGVHADNFLSFIEPEHKIQIPLMAHGIQGALKNEFRQMLVDNGARALDWPTRVVPEDNFGWSREARICMRVGFLDYIIEKNGDVDCEFMFDLIV